MSSLLSYISLFTAIVGPFAILDNFLPQNLRSKLANYIFGFHTISFANFERANIDTFVGFFFSGDKILKIRVMCFSLLTCIGVAILFHFSEFFSNFNLTVKVNIILFGLIFLLSLPLDFANLKISYFIYFRQKTITNLWVKFTADFIFSLVSISIGGFVVLWLLITILDAQLVLVLVVVQENNVSILITFVLAMASASTVFFAVRISVLLAGAILRAVLTITSLNRYVVLVSSAHEHPLTFLGSFVAIPTIILHAIYN